jgi:hypothetical protein
MNTSAWERLWNSAVRSADCSEMQRLVMLHGAIESAANGITVDHAATRVAAALASPKVVASESLSSVLVTLDGVWNDLSVPTRETVLRAVERAMPSVRDPAAVAWWGDRVSRSEPPREALFHILSVAKQVSGDTLPTLLVSLQRAARAYAPERFASFRERVVGRLSVSELKELLCRELHAWRAGHK